MGISFTLACYRAPMNTRTILSLAAAFGLMSVSKAVSAQGDVHAEASMRLTYHLLALGLLLGALGLFIYAGVSAFRTIRGD